MRMYSLGLSALALPVVLSPSCVQGIPEQCHPNGYYEGIISGGGGLGELVSAIALDQLCGWVINRDYEINPERE